MTQNLERAGPEKVGRPRLSVEVSWGATQEPPKRSWWRRPWLLPLAVVIVWFLFYVWPPYLNLDPAKSLIPIRPESAVHFPMLVAHIAFGTIAMVTVFLQVWPWLRRRYPVVHRWVGRTYVFGGALPAVILAFLITPLSPFPTIGTTLGGVFWFVATVMGYVRGRQRRWVEHRRWMLYSFAMTLNVIWGRILMVVLPLTPIDAEIQGHAFAATPWLGWVINLIAVQWWLNRTANKPVSQLV